MREMLEFRCFDCDDVISFEVSEEDKVVYEMIGYFREGTIAYLDFFDSYGWTLRPHPYCQVCRYNHILKEEQDDERLYD